MRLIAAALAALVTFPALAANVTWVNPTQFEDNSPLVAADIASTTVQWSNGTTFGAVNGSQVVVGSATSVTLPDPPAGTSRCYRAFTTVVASKGGGSSVASNVSCKAVPFPNPKPPTLLEVLLAWLRGIWGRFA